MKGLLLKDFYTLFRQMKIVLVLILLFTLMPGYSVQAFAILYSAMMPITAMAYDERAGWNNLAVMMPYTPQQIVISKYLLGYAFVAVSSVLSLLVRFLYNLIRHTAWQSDIIVETVIFMCLAAILLAINLPFMFKVGVEKGRIMFLFLVAGGSIGIMFLQDKLTALTTVQINPSLLFFDIILATVILNVLSILISVRFFRKNR